MPEKMISQYNRSLMSICFSDFDGFVRTTNSGRSTIEVPVSVALGSDVALECDVLDANPPPQIKWYDNMGEIQEIRGGNEVRFLDNRHFLYLRRLRVTHLEQQYYCAVTNVNLSQEITAPTRYVLTDTLTQGELEEYKPIGDLRAFVGNTSFEFAYVGGVFGVNSNVTHNTLTFNNGDVSALGNVGEIAAMSLLSPGIFMLRARVTYINKVEIKRGTLTVHRKLIKFNILH
jgi:hypothetical protein